MLRYLLDTNIVIYVIKRRPLSALALFNENAGHMAISSITLAELMHGAEKSNVPARSLAAVEDFCSRLEVLPYGPKAPQCTMATFAHDSSLAVRQSVSMPCTSQPTHAARV